MLMIISIVISVADIFADLYNFSFGKLINGFYPCKQNPLQPLFCYTFYDFNLLILMAGIFIISLLIALISAMLFLRNNKRL